MAWRLVGAGAAAAALACGDAELALDDDEEWSDDSADSSDAGTDGGEPPDDPGGVPDAGTPQQPDPTPSLQWCATSEMHQRRHVANLGEDAQPPFVRNGALYWVNRPWVNWGEEVPESLALYRLDADENEPERLIGPEDLGEGVHALSLIDATDSHLLVQTVDENCDPRFRVALDTEGNAYVSSEDYFLYSWPVINDGTNFIYSSRDYAREFEVLWPNSGEVTALRDFGEFGNNSNWALAADESFLYWSWYDGSGTSYRRLLGRTNRQTREREVLYNGILATEDALLATDHVVFAGGFELDYKLSRFHTQTGAVEALVDTNVADGPVRVGEFVYWLHSPDEGYGVRLARLPLDADADAGHCAELLPDEVEHNIMTDGHRVFTFTEWPEVDVWEEMVGPLEDTAE